eukprot:TRINITY_DN11176_c0_g1_i1.p1 TRINITY_DN11176_c0_g1~~TRINITY_DN11176_c0_g1_i1.p1  ORF type:complete len:508 (+),score=85.22 TRINITY_DN11176_c0_g1_i1:1014-2537(+)
MTTSTTSRTIIHFDLDCFYAQVHMVQDPSLRTKPLGVKQKTILATTNYVARQMGVPKMARITEAKQICPSLVIVNGEILTPYRRASTAIFQLLQQLFPRCSVQRLGLDEFFVDATSVVDSLLQNGTWTMQSALHNIELSADAGWEGNILDSSSNPCKRNSTSTSSDLLVRLQLGSALAKHARDLLHRELNYTCSVGIAWNKVLAKMAGEVHKPNDQTTVTPTASHTLLELRGLKRIPGMGRAIRRELTKRDITSLESALALSKAELIEMFEEKTAEHVFQLLRGNDDEAVTMTGKPLSMSNEDNIGLTSDIAHVAARMDGIVRLLLDRVDEDHELYNRFPRTLRISACGPRYRNRTSKQEAINKNVFTMADKKARHDVVMDLCLTLFHKLKPSPFQVSVITVGVTNFEDAQPPEGHQSIDRYFSVSAPTKDTKKHSGKDDDANDGSESPHKHGGTSALAALETSKHAAMTKTASADSNTNLDGMFTCALCGVVLPEFCREPHQLFHS